MRQSAPAPWFRHNSDRKKIPAGKGIELNPKKDKAKAYYNRGLAYSNKSEYDLAIRDLSQAIILNPEHTKAYYNRDSPTEARTNMI